MKEQLTKHVSTGVAITGFRDSLDHGVDSVGDGNEGAAQKAYKYSCCNFRF
jgi:hypothetical protein